MARRLWIKVDALYFEETSDLTLVQQVALLKLISYVKRTRGDGHLDRAALRREQVSAQTLGALVEGQYIEVNDTGWLIRRYAEWQGADVTAARSEAGKKGAAARWGGDSEGSE